MNSTVLDKIQGLNNDLENGNSIEFELNGYISKFIMILTPDYVLVDKTATDKIEHLKGIDKLNEYEKKDMEQFLNDYHDSLKIAIEITTKLKPTELVKNDVVIGDINNTQPNSAPDETELPVKNELDKFDGTFGEEQEASGCGRHALNNLLGHAYFTGYKTRTDDNPYTLVELKDIIENITEKQLNLDKLCKYLTIRDNDKKKSIIEDDNHNDCPEEENYNINVLITALGLIGFEINNTFQLTEDKANKGKTPEINDANVFGLLININKTHWVSARKIDKQIYYMDSLKGNKVIAIINYDNLNEIILNTNNTTHTIINNGDQKKVFINLKIDDFIKNKIKDPDKKIIYYDKLSNYIHDLKDEEIINNLYSKDFQYSQKLTSLIKTDINYKNREKILKLLLESKTNIFTKVTTVFNRVTRKNKKQTKRS